MPLTQEDLAQVKGIVDAAVVPLSTRVAQAQTAAQNAHQVAEEAAKAKGPTAEAVKAQVDAALAAAETARQAEAAKAAGETAKAQARAEKRTAFLAAHGGKVPPAYLAAEVPDTDDEVQLKVGLDKAAAAFKADIESGRFGVKPATVGAAGPKTPSEGPAVTSPVQRLAEGLAESGK